jgi:23S rRNA pseudouridine1911/1915/1917 synthase
LGGVTLLQLRLKTGRTHQIRVHCAAIGRPIAGDPVYGRHRPAKDSPHLSALLACVRRQMLHAWRLEIDHPATGERMVFESPLPEDMERLIEKIEGRSGEGEGGKFRRRSQHL